MRGPIDIKGSDRSGTSVISLFCAQSLSFLDKRIAGSGNEIALDAGCSLLFIFVILYIISYMTHYLDIHGTIEQYRATLGF